VSRHAAAREWPKWLQESVSVGPLTNADTPRGAESPIRDVTVTEHADAMHAKAGRGRRARANLSRSMQERANLCGRVCERVRVSQ
jgi:hypothetical protein